MSLAAPPGDTEAVWPVDAVEVGRVLDAWGLKGWIKVQPFTSDPQALFSSRRWFIRPPDELVVAPPGLAKRLLPTVLKISHAKQHGDLIVAQVHDAHDRSDAEALRGARIFVGRSSFPTAGPDEFYWVDLIGLSVVNRDGDALGSVVGLLDTGPHSVLRVAPSVPGLVAAESERLIPFVGAYIDDVSLERRCITVDWGLDF